MSRGFTLLEVVVALLVLEVGVLAAAGTLALASRTLGDAEHLERAVAEAEGVLDSLTAVPAAEAGSRAFAGGDIVWSLDSAGAVSLRATGAEGDTLFEVQSAVLRP